MNDRKCTGCGLDHVGNEALCSVCWSAIPGKYRTAIRAAQKALGYNPASKRLQDAFDQAIAAGTGAIK